MPQKTSLYVHIPFCHHKCDYCDFFSVQLDSKISDDFVKSLLNEAFYYKTFYNIDSWSTIYIGGGTPSLLSPVQLSTLLDGLVSLSKDFPDEITVEMNSESVDSSKIQSCIDSGVTRFSLGLQSRLQASLDAVGRITSVKLQDRALNLLKKEWKGHLNLDVMAGLPRQNAKDFEKGLGEIISFGSDHISMYSLMIEEETPLFKSIEDGRVEVDDEKSDEQWFCGRKMLEDAGFVQYEVSNFARKGGESLHNMSYWQQKNYIGIGPGAAGTWYDFEKGSLRWTDTTDITRYIAFWKDSSDAGVVLPRTEEKLDPETLEFEFLMMGLRTIYGVSSSLYEARYTTVGPWHGDLKARLYARDSLWSNFEEKGYTEMKQKGEDVYYSLNGKGLMFLNELLLSF